MHADVAVGLLRILLPCNACIVSSFLIELACRLAEPGPVTPMVKLGPLHGRSPSRDDQGRRRRGSSARTWGHVYPRDPPQAEEPAEANAQSSESYSSSDTSSDSSLPTSPDLQPSTSSAVVNAAPPPPAALPVPPPGTPPSPEEMYRLHAQQESQRERLDWLLDRWQEGLDEVPSGNPLPQCQCTTCDVCFNSGSGVACARCSKSFCDRCIHKCDRPNGCAEGFCGPCRRFRDCACYSRVRRLVAVPAVAMEWLGRGRRDLAEEQDAKRRRRGSLKTDPASS